MKRFEEDVAQRLAMLADEADTRALGRIRRDIQSGGTADTVPRARRWRRRLAAIAVGAAVAVVSITALNLTGAIGGTSQQSSTSTADAIPPDIKPGEPCAGARRLAVDKLLNLSKTPVWMPNTSLANQGTLTGTWMCSGVVLTFGGISVGFEPAGNIGDPEKLWTDLTQGGAGGRVETVLGRPAFVQPPLMDKLGNKGRGEVLVDVDGTLVRVMGDGNTPVDEMVSIANSLNVKKPLTPTS